MTLGSRHIRMCLIFEFSNEFAGHAWKRHDATGCNASVVGVHDNGFRNTIAQTTRAKAGIDDVVDVAIPFCWVVVMNRNSIEYINVLGWTVSEEPAN